MKDDQDRFVDLEIRIAHLQRDFDELNSVVVTHTRELGRLAKALRRLGERVDALESKQPSGLDLGGGAPEIKEGHEDGLDTEDLHT